jgi:hypothetical protein
MRPDDNIFPQFLHRPYRIGPFESDEIVIMVVYVFIAYCMTRKLLLLLPLIIYYYRKYKEKNPRGYFKMIRYKLGIMNFKGYPISFIDKFEE